MTRTRRRDNPRKDLVSLVVQVRSTSVTGCAVGGAFARRLDAEVRQSPGEAPTVAEAQLARVSVAWGPAYENEPWSGSLGWSPSKERARSTPCERPTHARGRVTENRRRVAAKKRIGPYKGMVSERGSQIRRMRFCRTQRQRVCSRNCTVLLNHTKVVDSRLVALARDGPMHHSTRYGRSWYARPAGHFVISRPVAGAISRLVESRLAKN